MDLDIELALEKAQSILNQKKEQELEQDFILKNVIQIIFKLDDKIEYPKINDPKMLLIKFLDIVFELFSLNKKTRKTFYQRQCCDIKNEAITNSLNYCKKNENCTFYLNEDIKELYVIIKSIYSKENCSLFDFLDNLICIISFMLHSTSLLEFTIYSLIEKLYLNKYQRKLELNEIELDLNNTVCLSLLKDIFSNKLREDESLFAGLLSLKFKTIKNKFNDVNVLSIINAIKNIISKPEKISISTMNNNEIINNICDEISNILNKNKPEKLSNIKNVNNIKEGKIPPPKHSNIFDSKCIGNDINNTNIMKFGDNNTINYKRILDELFKKILNNIKMDDFFKEDLNKKFNEIKQILNILIEKNNNEINSIKSDNSRLYQKINDMETQIDRLKEDLFEKDKKIIDTKNQINKLKEDSSKEINKLKEDLSVREKEISDINEKLDLIEENLNCPISLTLIEDPVITPDGITYDKKSLLAWLKKSKNDPFTKKEIKEKELYPNLSLKNIIDSIKKK